MKLLNSTPTPKRSTGAYSTSSATQDVAGFTPAADEESAQWAAIVSTADDNRINYCKALSSKTLFSAMYGNYIVTLNELKFLAMASAPGTKIPAREEGFKEVGGGNDTV